MFSSVMIVEGGTGVRGAGCLEPAGLFNRSLPSAAAQRTVNNASILKTGNNTPNRTAVQLTQSRGFGGGWQGACRLLGGGAPARPGTRIPLCGLAWLLPVQGSG